MEELHELLPSGVRMQPTYAQNAQRYTLGLAGSLLGGSTLQAASPHVLCSVQGERFEYLQEDLRNCVLGRILEEDLRHDPHDQPHKPQASMSSSSRAPSHSDSGRTSHFFEIGEKCGKPTETPHHARLRVRLPHQDQGENLEDHHQHECQRSAQQYAANSSRGKTLKTFLTTTTQRNWIVDDLLGNLLLERDKTVGTNTNCSAICE